MVIKEKFLYIVVIGGSVPKANIEIHDVRWVIGSNIEDTFDSLRKNWFGTKDGLHIDSYKKIEEIDGYKVIPRNKDNNNNKNNRFKTNRSHNKKLWFVNLGGYDPSSMQEKHEFGLVVASSSFEAQRIAKSKWLMGCQKIHKDNVATLQKFCEIDNCAIIKNIENWEIELLPVIDYVKTTNFPDWFGYMRIDR
jgi:hypothetical protein